MRPSVPKDLPEQCWNAIGSWSPQPTCSLLSEVEHCRRCNVYVSQGRRLLEQAIPDSLRDDWSESISRPLEQSETLSHSAVVFRLFEEHFALSTSVFDEVTSLRPIHSIPHRNDKIVRGFAAFRGRLELCVSMENLLGLAASEATSQASVSSLRDERRMLVVSRNDERRFLFEAPAVLGACRYSPETLDRCGGDESNFFPYLDGVFQHRGWTVGLINSELIFEAIERSLVRR